MTDEAIRLHSEILRMQRPANRTIKAFRKFFENTYKTSGGHPQLQGDVEGEIYTNEDDLLSLYTPLDEDMVTLFISTVMGWLFIVSERCGYSGLAMLTVS
jgi:hypothetical protein